MILYGKNDHDDLYAVEELDEGFDARDWWAVWSVVAGLLILGLLR